MRNKKEHIPYDPNLFARVWCAPINCGTKRAVEYEKLSSRTTSTFAGRLTSRKHLIHAFLYANWKHRRITYTTGNENRAACSSAQKKKKEQPRGRANAINAFVSAFFSAYALGSYSDRRAHLRAPAMTSRRVQPWPWHSSVISPRYSVTTAAGARGQQKLGEEQQQKKQKERKKPWTGSQASQARCTCNWVSPPCVSQLTFHGTRNSFAELEAFQGASSAFSSSFASLYILQRAPRTEELNRRNRRGKSWSGSVGGGDEKKKKNYTKNVFPRNSETRVSTQASARRFLKTRCAQQNSR